MTTPDPMVYVVDDDLSVVRALQRLFQTAGIPCRAFSCPADFVGAVEREALGCVVLDLSMPGMDGLAVQRALKDVGSALSIVFIAGGTDIASTVRALKQGAVDFLSKPFQPQALLDVVAGALELSRERWSQRNKTLEATALLAQLTAREHDVLRYVIGGHLNKQTADRLGMTEKTVKFHRGNILRKLHLASPVELRQLADRAGVAAVDRRR